MNTMIEAGDRVPIISKRDAICTLLPYAIFLGRAGCPEMVDVIFRVVRASKSCWFIDPIGSYITTLVGKLSSSFLNSLITMASPHVCWEDKTGGENMVRRWAAAALVVVDTEEVSQYVVDTLLQIASICSLRPHIPIGIWVWLKKRPSLPPVCLGRRCGTTPDTIRYVRGLGDVEILRSYLLLVWSEWDDLCIGGLDEMETAIREEFGGIWVRGHRKDLYDRLEYVLERLGLGLEYLGQHNPQVKQYRIEAARGQYGRLKQVLRDVDMEAVKRLACKPPNFALFDKHTGSHGHVQDLIPPPFVSCPFRACCH